MTGAERGWLLLCADLADGLRPMTLPQVRSLRAALRQNDPDLRDPDRELTDADLRAAGLDRAARERILRLLGREAALDAYLSTALLFEIYPLTVVSPDYPRRLRERLGDDAPAVLFCCGDPRLLSRPGVSLTGSRSLDAASAEFARQVGALAAREGKVLISGNALGADQTAQNACLDAHGDWLAPALRSLPRLAAQPADLRSGRAQSDRPDAYHRRDLFRRERGPATGLRADFRPGRRLPRRAGTDRSRRVPGSDPRNAGASAPRPAFSDRLRLTPA